MPVSQELRRSELTEVYKTARDHNLILSKIAEAGFYGTRSVARDGFEAAGWTDDLGNYIVVNAVGLIPIKQYSVDQILEFIIYMLVLGSVLLMSLLISRLYNVNMYISLMYVSIASVLTITVFESPIGIIYSRSDQSLLGGAGCKLVAFCSPVDLFYGVQSAVLLCITCVVVLLNIQNPTKPQRNAILQLVALASAVAVGTLFRADILLGYLVLQFVTKIMLNRTSKIRIVIDTFMVGVLALAIKSVFISLLYIVRQSQTGLPAFEMPQGHPIWHALYLGLAFNFKGVSEVSAFNIVFQDNFLYQSILSRFPSVILNSKEYSRIVRSEFIALVRDRPTLFVSQLLSKTGLVLLIIWPQSLSVAVVAFSSYKKKGIAPRVLPFRFSSFVFGVIAVAITFSAGAIAVWPSLAYIPASVAFIEMTILVLMFPLAIGAATFLRNRFLNLLVE